MKKTNCWEFKECGREPEGEKAGELGVCPATVERKLHGAHGGENSGRACWVVAGSMCKGEIQGTFAQKYENCYICDFYLTVAQDEALNMISSATLLLRLK